MSNRKNKRNVISTVTAAPSATTTEGATIETQAEQMPTQGALTGELKPTLPPLFSVERDISAIKADFSVNTDTGELTLNAGQKLTAAELGFVIAEEIKGDVNGRLVRFASTMRLARTMPEVEIPLRDAHGDIIAGKVRKVPAFEWVREKLRTSQDTDAAFQGFYQLVPCLDFKSDNPSVTASPFTVKNILPYLREIGALPKIDKKVDWTAGALTVKKEQAEGAAKGASEIMLALESGATQKEIAAVRAEVEEMRKPTPPALPASTTPAETPKETPEGETPKETPEAETPAEETKETPAETQAPTVSAPAGIKPGDAPLAPNVRKHDIHSVLAAVRAAVQEWDAAAAAGVPVGHLRTQCAQEVANLAKLAGFKCSALD